LTDTLFKTPLVRRHLQVMQGMQSLAGLGGGAPGGTPGGAKAEPVDDGKFIDLADNIEKNQCYARNENSGFPMSNLLLGIHELDANQMPTNN